MPHALWNAAEVPARMLELISPAGFEGYFAAVAELFASGPPDPARAAALQQHYHLDMDFASVPRLNAASGLQP